MAGDAGYTGVVYDEADAGYTSAEGYTGVVRTRTASGYTGAAPVSGGGQRSAPRPAPAGSPAGATARSSYDPVTLDGAGAPGSGVVDSPGGATTSTTIDLAEVRETEEQGGTDAARQGSGDPGQGSRTSQDIAQFASLAGQVQDAIRQSPGADSNGALEQAVATISAGSSRGLGGVDPIAGLFARQLNEQIAEVVAQSSPGTLGEAYIQGVVQELAATIISGGGALLDTAIDPGGSAIRDAAGFLGEISSRMREGETFWEAVNSILNPAVRLFNGAWEADEIAGRAASAARAGDWREAVRLARLSGRSAARGGVAAGELVVTARGLAKKIESRRTRRTARSLDDTPAQRQPPGDGTPPGETPAAIAPVAAPSRSLESARPSTRPHRAYPEVRIPDPNELTTARKVREALLERQRKEAAGTLSRLAPEDRRNPQQRIGPAKPIYDSLEWLTAAELQKAHPERGYLTQVRLLEVETPTGVTPVERITTPLNPGERGRRLDTLELLEDGSFQDHEHKTTRSILDAYPRRGGVQVPSFKDGSTLGKEIDKTRGVFEYARDKGGTVRALGVGLDGKPVEIRLDPTRFRGTVPGPYGQVPN